MQQDQHVIDLPSLMPRYGQNWIHGKRLDGTCPLGPVVVLSDECLIALDTACRVSGEVRQQSNTEQVIFKVRNRPSFSISHSTTSFPTPPPLRAPVRTRSPGFYWQHLHTGKIVALPWCDFMDIACCAAIRMITSMSSMMCLHTTARRTLQPAACRLSWPFRGRLLMAPSIGPVLETIRRASDVWLATHDHVVDWFKQQQVDRIEPSLLFGRSDG